MAVEPEVFIHNINSDTLRIALVYFLAAASELNPKQVKDLWNQHDNFISYMCKEKLDISEMIGCQKMAHTLEAMFHTLFTKVGDLPYELSCNATRQLLLATVEMINLHANAEEGPLKKD